MNKILLFLLSITSIYAQTVIRVPQDYKEIQTALDSSNNYDTILVSKGVYNENLEIMKPVSIIGDTNKITLITPDLLFKIPIYINTSHVLLRNIHIKKETHHEGIMIENSNDIRLDNCIVDSNMLFVSFGTDNYFHGIYIVSSKNVQITNSIIKDNWGGVSEEPYSFDSYDGIGIVIDSSSNIEVNKCFLHNNRSPESSGYSYGYGIGIKIIKSDSSIYIRNCTITNNDIGILFNNSNSFAYIGSFPSYVNEIYNNVDYNIKNESINTINATYNYWGTNNIDSISAKLYGHVDFNNFITGINILKEDMPKTFMISQNYPNPFNPVTFIKYDLPMAGTIKISIFDAIGRLVKELCNNYQKAGEHKILFNGEKLSSGIYYYLIEYKGHKLFKKMVLLK